MSRPWFPLYVADYLADTLDLGAEDHGCYMLLLMIAWRRDVALPNDMAFLKRACDERDDALSRVALLEAALDVYARRETYISRTGMDSPISRDGFGNAARAALKKD
jgi:uncharacterized protein YdaU (DUF1376 family)